MEGEQASCCVFYGKLFTFSKQGQDGFQVLEGGTYVQKYRSFSMNEVQYSQENISRKSNPNQDSSYSKVAKGLHKHEDIDLSQKHNFNVHLRTYFMKLTSEEKIQTFAQILTKYRQLVTQHGLFFLTPDHVKFNESGELLVRINKNCDLNEPQWPLCSNRFGQVIAMDGIREMIRKYLSERIYKFSKLDSLDEMVFFMEKMQRRTSIHKKCQTMVAIKSSSNKNDQTMCQTPEFNEVGLGFKEMESQFISLREKSLKSKLYSKKYMIFPSEKSVNKQKKELKQKQRSNTQKQTKIQKMNKQNGFSWLPLNKSFSKQSDKEDKSHPSINKKENTNMKMKSKSSLQHNFNQLFLSQLEEDPENDLQAKKECYHEELLKQFHDIIN